MRILKIYAVFLCLSLLAGPLAADVRLPSIIGSYMVLQRDRQVPIFGWAEPAEKVTVEFSGNTVSTIADAQGKWQVNLPAMKASFEFRKMTITANNTIELVDIMVGDVWLCSGQSNMQMGILVLHNGEKVGDEAQYNDKIRLIGIPNIASRSPQEDVPARWTGCNPQDIKSPHSGLWGGFSALGYFFGRQMYNELNVPIGLINCSWGGTKVETWVSKEKIYSTDVIKPVAERLTSINAEYTEWVSSSLGTIQNWIDISRKAIENETDMPQTPVFPYNRLEKGAYYFHNPTAVFNGMVNPIIPFGIRGVIWYQGESNCGDGMIYYDKQRAMIEDWRQRWGWDFPFYYVQIAPFRYGFGGPVLPEIWEAQTRCLDIDNTAMAVTIDITDDLGDIHPQNKLELGRRLALCALANEFGRDIEYSGPIYKSMAVEGSNIRIAFDHTGSGLMPRDGNPLNWFEIAGANGVFVSADAVIDGNSVIVSSPEVAAPINVRFGWNEIAIPNLCNKEGLPAVSFKSY